MKNHYHMPINIEIIKQKAFDNFLLLGKKIIGPLVGFIIFIVMKMRPTLKHFKIALWTHRLSYSESALVSISNYLNNDNINNMVLLELVSDPPDLLIAAKRILIVRWPVFENNEILSKGVLIITFTNTFSFFLKNIDISFLERFFNIVLEPSWSGYSDPDILMWKFLAKNNVFVQASEILDKATLDAIGSPFVTVSIGASDWVDYKLFHPVDCKKIYDSVYVANTTMIKRINKYLKTIKEIKLKNIKNYRAALVCATWGGREEEVKKLIKYYDVENECDIYFSLEIKRLREIISMSKVSILLSKKEGSNRSLFESMFCNTPVLALVDNVGVNKAYINELTGNLTWDSHLESSLLFMREKWDNFSPRDWAMKNIAPEITTLKLMKTIAYNAKDNVLLNDLCVGKNYYVKVNRPEIEYFSYPKFNKKRFNTEFLCLFCKNAGKNEIESKIRKIQINFNNEIKNFSA